LSGEPVSVRRAVAVDAAAIADIHVDSWDATYRGLIADPFLDLVVSQRAERVERWRGQLSAAPGDRRTWVAERDGEVLGFSATGPCGDTDAEPGSGEVFAIYLRPDAIGSGVGRVLFGHAVADLGARGFAPLTLWVLRQNLRARRFYEAAGWRPDGAEKVETVPGAELSEVRYRAG
jgi:GNAT superfamily N-acetyltransferase